MRSTENIISTRAVIAGLALATGLAGCASTPRSTGELAAPLARLEVSSDFGRRSATRPHYGTDFRAPEGTPVTAAADGKVIFAGRQRGFGQVIILDHGRGTETYYAHMSAFTVRKGSRVRRGETIGFVGQTGNATGPHLHFEVRKRGKPVDPMLHLSTRPRS